MTSDASWSRIKELFQAAMERAPKERVAFLEQACGEDHALHQEVVSLLSAHQEAGRFAERPAIETLAETTPADVDYQILSTLGAGGMGEVFRARDVALGRDVAIKILPPSVADDPAKLARFDREARVLASLNHPNICAIHGITDISGTPGLVLELVEGPTLGERLANQSGTSGKARRLGTKEALTIGRDIARALEAAHEKGIIHRDLKPANIKITPDGVVKVLDFGLAKASMDDPVRVGLQASAQWAAGESEDGVRLGTAAYMSPEQARGEPVDKRTDIWAFGAVLYEMFSGRRATPGETVSETIAAVLESEPDWTAVPASVPPNIRRLVRRCLEKDAKRRLKDIGDACLELEDALSPSETDVSVGHPARTAMPRRVWLLSLIAMLGFAAAAFLAWPDRSAERPTSVTRLTAELGTDATLVTLGFGQGSPIVLSPDGAVLAFVAQSTRGAARQIYVRRLDELKAVPLSGTEDALNPFFSPDGRWVAFFAEGTLKKVPTAGGGSVTICACVIQANRGGAWGEDGQITFSPDRANASLWQVSSEGNSVPFQLTTLGEGEVTQRWPQMLLGGKAVLFTGNSRPDGFQEANVIVQSLPNGPRKVLVPGAYYGRYLASGHLAYVHDGTVFAAPFDLTRLALTGPAVAVLEGAMVLMPVGAAEITFSEAGAVAYLPAPEQVSFMDAPIDWMDRSGATTPLRTTATRWLYPRFASDGRRLAFAMFDGKQQDIWIYDWSRDQMTKLTFDASAEIAPVWTPDASRIVFQSTRGGARLGNLWWQRVDGAGEPQRLTKSDGMHLPGSWYPNGKILAYSENDAVTGIPSVMLLRLDGDEASGWHAAEPTLFLSGADEPMFSPDGRWLAYTARSWTARPEVFVRPYPGPGGPWQISTQGGSAAVWSSKSPEVFYGTPDSQIMVASYSVNSGSFQPDKPRLLPNSQFSRRVVGRSFDLHPDGDRFALVKASAVEASRNRVTVVLNFFDELRRIAPAAR